MMSVHEEHSHDMSPTKSRLFRGNRRYFMLVCARAGKYTSSIPTEVNTLPTLKHECPARITVGIKDNK